MTARPVIKSSVNQGLRFIVLCFVADVQRVPRLGDWFRSYTIYGAKTK